MTNIRMSAISIIAVISLFMVRPCDAPASEAKVPGILFAVTDTSRVTSIEPFAYVVDGKLINIPNDVDQQQFGKRYYSDHHRYTLFVAGRAGGSVEVGQPLFDTECENLGADAAVTLSGKVTSMRMALASNVPLRDLDYARRSTSDAEKTAIMGLATHVYIEHGVPADWATKARVSNLTAVQGKSGTVLIGSFIVQRQPRPGADPVDEAVFLIAERNAKGAYEATYSWFHSGAESATQKQDLVDIVDIAGTGFPDVVTEIDYYESTDYHVYRKAGGKWGEIYRSPASGC